MIILFFSPVFMMEYEGINDLELFFPFWQANLFDFAPLQVTSFEILVLKFDNVVYSKGVELREFRPVFAGLNFSSSKLINKIGESFIKRSKNYTVEAGNLCSLIFADHKNVELGLFSRTWRPFDRYSRGEILKETMLDKFICDKN